jgi:hypothetical protein
MDRRTFVQGGTAGLLTYTCRLTNARGTTTLHGCRMAANAGDSLGITLREPKTDMHKHMMTIFKSSMSDRFGVRPGMSYYDDGDAPNALADPRVMFPDGPDGTVLIGMNLFGYEMTIPSYSSPEAVAREAGRARQEAERAGTSIAGTPTGVGFGTAAVAIVAHELGHIMQYKLGMTPEGPWQMEPHADFMAGWFMGGGADEGVVEAAVRTLFDKGDYAFNDRDHHGEPEFRAAMVRAGYESGHLDAKQAFEKGKKFAGLN